MLFQSVDETLHVIVLKEVLRFASFGAAHETEEDLRTLGRAALQGLVPGVPGGGRVGGGAAVVVVVLEVELVELGVVHHVGHDVVLGDAHRCTRDDVLLTGAGELVAKLLNGGSVLLAMVVLIVVLDVEVEAIERHAAHDRGAAALTVLIPEVVRELYALALGKSRGVNPAADGHGDLLAIGLAGGDVLTELVTAGLGVAPERVARVSNICPADPTGVGDGDTVLGVVAVEIDEGEDDSVDVFLTDVFEVLGLALSPVDGLSVAAIGSRGVGGVGDRGANLGAGTGTDGGTSAGEAGQGGNGSGEEKHCDDSNRIHEKKSRLTICAELVIQER